MSWIAKLSSSFLFIGAALLCLYFFIEADSSPITIQSLESKTNGDGAVFNKIYYKSSSTEDVWMMEQSHEGLAASPHKWDKIAIRVDKTKKPYTAEFSQLMPGPEKISMDLKPTDLKASCYMCHSSGPRAIRPDLNGLKLSYWNRLRLQFWNLKIKTYGPIESTAIEFNKAFKHKHPFANRQLKVAACTKCHNNKSLLGRNFLTKQNFGTIKFMLDNKIMPPPGFSVSKKEKAEILGFIKN